MFPIAEGDIAIVKNLACDAHAMRCCICNNIVRITFDPVKRDPTMADRGLDFADAALVFEGVTVEIEDFRKNA